MDFLGPGCSLRPASDKNNSVPSSDPMQVDVAISDLPKELVLKIMFQLPWRIMVCLGRTCRVFWSYAQHNGLWFNIANQLLSLPRCVPKDIFNTLSDGQYRDLQIGAVIENMLLWLNHSKRHMLTSLVTRPLDATPPPDLIRFGPIRDFGMVMIDDAGTVDNRSLSTTNLQDDIMLSVTNQANAFSTLLTQTIGTLVSPLTKPNDSSGHRNDADPMTLVLGADETKSHYVLRMPLRTMLRDVNHIWRHFVKLCWMESMRQYEASCAIHNLSIFYNVKMRRLQSAELAHGALMDTKLGPNRIDQFPSIINCPSKEAVDEYEMEHPGGSLCCKMCKRVVSIGQSEGFVNNTASALMQFRQQQSVYCSSHCMLRSLETYGADTLLCSNPDCRSCIPLSRAMGSWDMSTDKSARHLEWATDPATLRAFSDELQPFISDEKNKLYCHGFRWWQLGSKFMQSKQFLHKVLYSLTTPGGTTALPAGPPQLNTSAFIPNARTENYSIKRFYHVAHFLSLLPETSDPTFVNNYLGTTTSTWDMRLTRYQLFAQNLSKDYREHVVGDTLTGPKNVQVPDIHRGQYLPLGTIGLGLPAVKAFFDIPFVEFDNTWASVEYIQAQDDPERFVNLLNALKFDAYCTGSCRRRSNCTTRCLNASCRSVFDLEMAPLSMECYELVLIQINPRDPDQTNERPKGYVCDEYCAQAYFDQCAKAIQQQQQQSRLTSSSTSPKRAQPNTYDHNKRQRKE